MTVSSMAKVYPEFGSYSSSSHESSRGLKRLGQRASKYVLGKRVEAMVNAAVRAPHNMDYPPKKMALITSDCGTTCSLSIKYP